MLKQTKEFKARDDSGREYTIVEFTDMVETRTRGGLVIGAGQRSLQTEDGLTVNRIDKGVYEVLGLRMRLTSDDPSAP